jgi:hypothetical protein
MVYTVHVERRQARHVPATELRTTRLKNKLEISLFAFAR